MHVLVATPRFILLVDLAAGKVEVVEAHRPEYYGISWFPGSSDLVLSHSALNNAALVDLAAYATSEVGFVSEGARRSPPFLSQPHQLVCGSDGRIIVTNTGRNRIQVIELDRPGCLQEVGISERRWDRLERGGPGGDHLNSVFERGGHLYAIAHGYRNGSRLAVFTYPGLSLISADRIPYATGVHNVFLDQDDLIIGCHSEIGGLIDLKRGSVLWQSGSRVWTRGLAASSDYLLVGESEMMTAEGRASCAGGIWIIDRRTFKTRDYVPLGPYGAVHEVRLIDIPDDAHHGVPLAGGVASIIPRLASVTRAAKLQSSERIIVNGHYWTAFSTVLGTSMIDEDGWKSAGEDVFLAIRREPTSAQAVNYRLRSAGTSHMSLVAGYRGNGADTNMDAFLLHQSGETATLQLWRQDGIEWKPDKAVVVTGLPLAAQMEIRILENTASIFLNGRIILSGTRLQDRTCHEAGLGIRVSGASVRPAEPAQGL